jgi:RNA polymerase sigma factor (TIGR02999 family)
MTAPPAITELLHALNAGAPGAADQVFELVYAELKQIARSRLAGERAQATLTPTALVHETYLRLMGSSLPDFADARHFVAVSAIAMRRVLIERARAAQRDKRGGGQIALTLPPDVADTTLDPSELLQLDAALVELERLDADMARVVELRYFAGLSVEETARVLDIAPRSVNRHWTAARAWLARALA